MPSTNTYTAQDRTPYTYFIRWNDLNLNYYGRRTAKGCRPEEFFITYFTSSKYVLDVISEYGMPDIIKIHKIFSDIESCRIQEEQFLTRVNASKSLDWLNQTNGDKKFDTTNSIPWNKGIPRSEKTKFLISNKLKGKNRGPQSKETCLKKSIANKGQIPWHKGLQGLFSEESRAKMSKSKLNKPRPQHVKDRLSETKKNMVLCLDLNIGKVHLIPREEFLAGKGTIYFGVASKTTKNFLSKQ